MPICGLQCTFVLPRLLLAAPRLLWKTGIWKHGMLRTGQLSFAPRSFLSISRQLFLAAPHLFEAMSAVKIYETTLPLGCTAVCTVAFHPGGDVSGNESMFDLRNV